jgi:DtxR family manganese transport transcriptional regulator
MATPAKKRPVRRAFPGAGARPRPHEEEADRHRLARAARSTQTTEDYVEVIADLIDGEGEARVVDIARRLGVTHVTVVRTIGRLKRDNLVTMQPYRAVFLTGEGRGMAERVRRRHNVVVRFLEAIGVKPEAARIDAEGIEHHVSGQTLAAFERFLRKC